MRKIVLIAAAAFAAGALAGALLPHRLACVEPQRQQVLQGFNAMAADGARVPGVRMRP